MTDLYSCDTGYKATMKNNHRYKQLKNFPNGKIKTGFLVTTIENFRHFFLFSSKLANSPQMSAA